MATATFALGCFWSPEQRFRSVEGVTDVTVGYTGGQVEDPGYKQVCSGGTGHAEAVRIEYDPDVISYDDLLTLFWEGHNPTTRDRQGLDRGSQYRSAIFTHDDEQAERAQATLQQRQAELQDSRKLPWGRTIVTEIEPADEFWPAEDYHQNYLAKRRGAVAR